MVAWQHSTPTLVTKEKTMQTLAIAVIAALALVTGALNASAGTELDRAMGAGAFIHPTGPVNGTWHSDKSTYQDSD